MPLILGTNSIKDTGYNVDNSLRFNDGSSDYLNRTLGTPTNNKKWTLSFWFKKTVNGANPYIFTAYNSSTNDNRSWVNFQDDDTISIAHYDQSAYTWRLVTNRLFRDVSAWYHIVVAVDTTQGTAANRVKLYINSVQETSFSTENYPDQNYDPQINSAQPHNIGRAHNDSAYVDGYIAEMVLIDGQQLDATSFGEFDEDSPTIWKPKDVSGLTFGNNGFYLEFKQSGTSQNSSGLGADTSGNDNHFAVNNLTAIDQSIDTCTNNFATLNSLNQISSVAYSEGNLKFTNSSGTNRLAFANFVMTQGKWYCEMKITEHNTNYTHIGLRNIGSYTLTNAYVNDPTNEKVSYLNGGGTSSAGRVFIHGGTETDNMPSYTSGDIIGMACDMDNGYLYYHKNGTYINSGNPASGGSGSGGFDIYNHGNVDYCFAVSNSDGGTDPVIDANFGSPAFAISSGNTDGEGYGNFEYAVPSGFFSMNSKNLAEYG